MPKRIPKACREARCPKTSIERHGYCEDHAYKHQSWSQSGKGRGGRPWRRIRDQVRQRANNLCEEHARQGLVVAGDCCDHIIPEAEGGTSILSNLQWLCVECHNKKTKEEAKRGNRRSLLRGGAG